MIAIAMGLNANLRRVVLGVILAFTLVFIATYIAGVVGLIDRMFIYFPDKTVSTSPESLGAWGAGCDLPLVPRERG